MSRDTLYQQLRGHLAYLKLAAAAEALPAHLEAAHKSQLGHSRRLSHRRDKRAVHRPTRSRQNHARRHTRSGSCRRRSPGLLHHRR